MVYTRDEAVEVVGSPSRERQSGSNERYLGHPRLAAEGPNGRQGGSHEGNGLKCSIRGKRERRFLSYEEIGV